MAAIPVLVSMAYSGVSPYAQRITLPSGNPGYQWGDKYIAELGSDSGSLSDLNKVTAIEKICPQLEGATGIVKAMLGAGKVLVGKEEPATEPLVDTQAWVQGGATRPKAVFNSWNYFDKEATKGEIAGEGDLVQTVEFTDARTGGSAVITASGFVIQFTFTHPRPVQWFILTSKKGAANKDKGVQAGTVTSNPSRPTRIN